jgi:hypothetical protein
MCVLASTSAGKQVPPAASKRRLEGGRSPRASPEMGEEGGDVLRASSEMGEEVRPRMLEMGAELQTCADGGERGVRGRRRAQRGERLSPAGRSSASGGMRTKRESSGQRRWRAEMRVVATHDAGGGGDMRERLSWAKVGPLNEPFALSPFHYYY